ncbi:MAG: DUF1993 domain-containing protein [Proteobacteria bacterium]|nr:DUF1993 domain-containing protein [Pseudomonadota bacterium]
MSKLSMHAITAPMFVTLLNNLNTWLDKAEEYAKTKKFDMEVLLSARLAPDMLPLRGQIHIATAWAKNCQCRLAGQTPPDFAESDMATIEGIRGRIARTIDVVKSISAAELEGSAERIINYNLGPEIKMSQPGVEYFTRVALPNFYFHVTTAYDILRHNGLQLGKQDFLAGAVELPKT